MRFWKGSALTLLLLCFVTGNASGEGFTNGSFEDGYDQDTQQVLPGVGGYHGWTLYKKTIAARYPSTWGKVTDGQFVVKSSPLMDFATSVPITQSSLILDTESNELGENGKTFHSSAGAHAAIMLNNGPDLVRMVQDVTLPDKATAISWDMNYMDMSSCGFCGNQYMAVFLRDTNDDALLIKVTKSDGTEVYEPSQWVADSSDPREVSAMTTYSLPLPADAPAVVRIVVEMNVTKGYFGANIDNFRVEQSPDVTTMPLKKIPPGWMLGTKTGWMGEDGATMDMPPGLEKNGKVPPGLMKENKGQSKK